MVRKSGGVSVKGAVEKERKAAGEKIEKKVARF